MDRGAGATDRTGAEEAEGVLRSAAGESDRANRAKSDFLATMSHEIRTPLNGLLGMTALLLDTELEPVQRQYAEMAHSSGETLLSLINDLLDHAKIESGSVELEDIDFDVREVVEDVLQLAAASARHKALEIQAVVDLEVPTLVRGDPGRLRQVLTNLTANAVKFTDAGAVTVEVALVESYADEVELRFEVTDTGVGLGPTERERLFRRFSQAEASTTRRFGGTGLGLAISKDLVALLGGDLGVTSEPGRGSTFSFTLGFDRVPVSSGAGASTGGPQEGDAHGMGRRLADDTDRRAGTRVLVVDDNVINQIVAARTLENMGYRVDVVADGAEAVAVVPEGRYAAVLMDCQMPGVDGYEATRRIRVAENGESRLPIIAMTAAAMDGEEERCLAAGMDDYITKPVGRELLASVLEQWVRSPANSTRDNAGTEPRPAKDAQASPLDETTTAELRQLMASEPGGFVGLVTRFVEDTAASLGSIRTALAAGDAATVGRELHTVMGAASAIAAHRLARLCRHCEMQLGTDRTAIGTHEIDAIEVELHRIVAWTRTH